MAILLPKSAETNALRIRLLELGLSIEDLAADCGIAASTLRTQLAKNFPSRRMRLIIEAVLGTRIWSTQHEFLDRRRQQVRLGFDIFTMSMDELRKKVTDLKIHGRSSARRRGDLVQLLAAHFNSPPTKKKNADTQR